MKMLAILQARVSSCRLPGKVMMPILGKPMLLQQIERLRGAVSIEKLVVATSLESSDDPIVRLCEVHGINYFRGSLNDVLDRYYQAAVLDQPEHVIRLTGDCPVADPAVIDRVITEHLKSGCDYTSNCLVPSFPDGLDVEVFRFECLEDAWRHARLPSQREHVTPYIREPSHGYKLQSVTSHQDFGQLRWTVDELDDLCLIIAFYEALYPVNPNFSMEDMLDLLQEHPDLNQINNHLVRNSGFHKSLDADLLYCTKDRFKDE